MKKKEEDVPVVIKKDDGVKLGTVVLIGVLVFFLCVVWLGIAWFVGTYNTLVVANEDINTQFGNIKTEYQRRADVLINMADVAKSYANFEQDTMVGVAEARSGNFGNTPTEEIENLEGLDKTLNRLMLVYEQYPQLKANEQYNKLTEELQRTENRIQIARSDYNTLIRSYNILIKRFPTNLLANLYGYSEKQMWITTTATAEYYTGVHIDN